MSAVRHVTVISPHFDDVPLSLGQSLRDGALSRCDVRVRVAFARSNWTTWVHPTAARAPFISWWRRFEETLAARRFGYRFTAARWDEALLRRGTLGGAELLDPDADLSGEPLVDEVRQWLTLVVSPPSGPRPELLLVPAGLGGHVDHRIVAIAAAELCRTAPTPVPVGFYEDRPYVAHMDEPRIAAQLAGLGPVLEPRRISGPVTAGTQRLVRRCYPSQMDGYFVEAMDLDRERGAVEQVWFPAGTPPEWLV